MAIFGLGEEGASTAKFLLENEVEFAISEKKYFALLPVDIQDLIKANNINLVSGENHSSGLKDFDVIFRSPGIPLWNPVLRKAKENGVEITSHTKLFFDLCPCPIIGVTGTKGKGTTATLIYEMLRLSGKQVFLGGNIGHPPLEFIDELNDESIVVLELSSFQLEDLTKSPKTAVLLMITQEHLDSGSADSPNFHRTIEEYLMAKGNILRFQEEDGHAVINWDFERSRNLVGQTKAAVHFFSLKQRVENGAYLNGECLTLTLGGKDSVFCKKSDVKLRGGHNIQNILAASVAAFINGAELDQIKEVLKSFRGLEHRLELVREVGGVKYYNDSFSTTPETTIAAIKSFDEPKVIIMGGSEKGSNYADLGGTIAGAKNIKAVILMGRTAEAIRAEISKITPSKLPTLIMGIKSMNDAVTEASKIVANGDVVVLSPACASFDMFKNYKERGQRFKDAVNKL